MSSDREAVKGITRINITGSRIARAEQAKIMWPASNSLYHKIFDPYLVPGSCVENCTLEEFKAGYDKFLGVDVLLTFVNGMTLTLQEKFLTTIYGTVTVEYYNDPRTEEPGDWFELKAQLYFVGYWNERNPDSGFLRWVLLDWPMMVLETQKGNIPWVLRGNTRSAARANFQSVEFEKIPTSCIVSRNF